jgi:glucose-1-phosphate cytidylyltransferase
VNISDLVDFHKRQGCLATLTAVIPPGRFGAIALSAGQNKILRFREKPRGDGAWVNGGFFVLEYKALDYIEGDATVWESGPLERLAAEGQLAAYRHEGFWQPMDTLRDRKTLEDLWATGKAPWKIWPDRRHSLANTEQLRVSSPSDLLGGVKGSMPVCSSGTRTDPMGSCEDQ